MNIKRAFGFAFFLYVSSFCIGLISFLFGWATETEYTLKAFILMWILYIPIIFLLAKWFFRTVPPTLKNGLYLGVITICVSFGFDMLFIAGTVVAGKPLGTFFELYASWEFYVTLIEVLALTTFAGYEFDATYTSPDIPST